VTALNRLFVRKLTSIGVVEEGDDPEAKIMLFKRRTEKRVVPASERDMLAGRGMALPDGSFPIKTVTDLKNAVKLFFRAKDKTAAKRHIKRQAARLEREDLLPDSWTKSADSAPIKGNAMDFETLGLDDETREVIETAFDVLRAKITELEDVEPVDVLKDAPDEVKKQFADQQAQIEKQAVELAAEKDARLTAEFTKTAETYTGVLGDAAEAGPKLKTLATTDAYDWLVEKLNAVAAIVATSDLFKELGVSDEADPKEQITVLAKEKQKDNPDLTIEQAKVLVRTERPDLKTAERSI